MGSIKTFEDMYNLINSHEIVGFDVLLDKNNHNCIISKKSGSQPIKCIMVPKGTVGILVFDDILLCSVLFADTIGRNRKSIKMVHHKKTNKVACNYSNGSMVLYGVKKDDTVIAKIVVSKDNGLIRSNDKHYVIRPRSLCDK